MQAQAALNAKNDDRETLSSSVYQVIKRDILTHRLAPGSRISENMLAAKHNTSKAPVRDALSRLQQERLVVQESPKMQHIAPLTLAGIREIFQARNLLEPEAAALAAGRIDMSKLRELNAKCARPVKVGDADDELAALLCNRDFHLAIANASGNSLLADYIAKLHDLTTRVLWLAIRTPSIAFVWNEGHDEIIDALEAQDGTLARKILLQHMREGQHQVFDALMSLPGLAEKSLPAMAA